MGACLLTNWGTNFGIRLTFLSLIEAIGKSGTFWLYALICGAFWLFTYFLIPETKGRSLEEIARPEESYGSLITERGLTRSCRWLDELEQFVLAEQILELPRRDQSSLK